MTDKHTPGPWQLWRNDQGAFIVRADLDDGYKGAVLCQRPEWPHRAAESNANARLIAAAPDLLGLVRWLQQLGGLGPEVHDKIRALIARIDGTQDTK